MTDPAFAARLRTAALSSFLPEWAPLAACAEKAPNQHPWEPMFADDVGHNPQANYTWPAKVVHAIAVCGTCPVRRECLNYAMESEHREEQSYWAAEMEDTRDGVRYGVYGGVPGPIRRHHRNDPDPVASCEAWYQRTFAVNAETGEVSRTGTM